MNRLSSEAVSTYTSLLTTSTTKTLSSGSPRATPLLNKDWTIGRLMRTILAQITLTPETSREAAVCSFIGKSSHSSQTPKVLLNLENSYFHNRAWPFWISPSGYSYASATQACSASPMVAHPKRILCKRNLYSPTKPTTCHATVHRN